jgi:hypothetical protein
LQENVDIKTAIGTPIKQNTQLKNNKGPYEAELLTLYKGCDDVGAQLLEALNKVKVATSGRKWHTFRKAL